MSRVPVIVGPTAVGKTEFALKIADRMAVEVISADSRQIYRHLDVGTAKPEVHDLQRIKHHFINHIDPDQYYSAGIFSREARQIIDSVLTRNIVPLVVGGSGFYIKALIDGLSEINGDDPKIRTELQRRLKTEGIRVLYRELQKIDPPLAEKIEMNDKQRILRAIEVFYSSGIRLSEHQKKPAEPANFQSVCFGLNMPRQVLYERINLRVDEMIRRGLIEEVVALQKKGYDRHTKALNTVGYQEVFDYLEGKLDRYKMIEQIKTNSRRYAKRQLTWFRRDKRIQWLQMSETKDVNTIADCIVKQIQ